MPTVDSFFEKFRREAPVKSAGEGRTGLGHPYQLNQSTVSAGF
jgi:hypothetical protein